jgi:hypothetical protein
MHQCMTQIYEPFLHAPMYDPKLAPTQNTHARTTE